MNSPSMQHYGFAFKLVPKLFVQPPQGMDPRLSPTLADADRVLLGMWRGAAMMCNEQPGVLQPQAARLDVGGRQGLLIYMPPTSRSPEATHVASLPIGDTWRYVTFERPVMAELGPVVGEVDASGTHRNLGGRPGPATADAFCERLSEIFAVPIRVSEPPAPITYTGTIVGAGPDLRYVGLGIIGVILLLGGVLAKIYLT